MSEPQRASECRYSAKLKLVDLGSALEAVEKILQMLLNNAEKGVLQRASECRYSATLKLVGLDTALKVLKVIRMLLIMLKRES